MAQGWQRFLVLLAVPLFGACSAVAPERAEYERGLASFQKHDYQGAEEHFSRSVELCMKDDCKECTAQLAQTLLSLARVYSEQGKYSSAERTLKRAVDSLTVANGPQSKAVAEAWLALAVCHHAQQEYAEAAEACKKALDIQNTAAVPDDLLMAATLNNLAESYQRLEREDEAEQLFTRSLLLYRAHKSDEKARDGMIDTLNNVALFFRHENRPGDARRIAEEALALTPGSSPKDVQRRASVLATLATLDRGQFDFAAAAKHYDQAIGELEKTQGTSEVLLGQTIDSYADMLLDQKDYVRAEQLYLDGIRHCRHALGPRHPSVAERMNDLAELYREQDRYPEAQKLLEEVLLTDRVAFEMDSPITFASMNSLSSVYMAQGKYAQAQRVYSDWMPTMVAVLGPDHPHVADALDNWALVAERADDKATAAQLRSKAKNIRRKLEQPLANNQSRKI